LPESVLRCASTSLTMVTEFLLSYWTSFIGLIHDGFHEKANFRQGQRGGHLTFRVPCVSIRILWSPWWDRCTLGYFLGWALQI
jgi:hypothetical protein